MIVSNPIRHNVLPDHESFLELQPQGWSWEWLRRSQDYRGAPGTPTAYRQLLREHPELTVIEASQTAPLERWPILFVENAEYGYAQAAVFWDSKADNSVLPVTAKSIAGNAD